MPITVTSVSSPSARLAADPVPVIRPSELAKTIAKGPVVVEFFNYGCPYCRAAMPELDRVASEKTGKVKFAKMSLGDPEAQRLAAQFGVTLLPGFAVFHDGQFLGEFGRQGAAQVGADFIRDNVEYAFSTLGLQV